jgi:hypothetical protein
MARPATMARERLKRVPGALASPWISSTDLEPVAAPAEEVAQRLGVTVEDVHACGVEPYLAADGRPLLSLHLTAVALGIRRSRLEKARQRDRRRHLAAQLEAEEAAS